jgi:hypothetical protein
MEFKDSFPRKEFIAKTEDNILYRKMWVKICTVAIPVLSKFDGKVITKRMLEPYKNQIEIIKVGFPEFGIQHSSYKCEYNTYRLTTWYSIYRNLNWCDSDDRHMKQDSISVDIGRCSLFSEDTKVVFDWKKFCEDHPSFVNPKEHLEQIKKYERALADVSIIESAYNGLVDLSKGFWDNVQKTYNISDYYINFK